jgi:membrane-associated phospholipid phosphatase
MGHLHCVARGAVPILSAAVGSADGIAASREVPRPWHRAAYWLLALGPFFFLSYGLANWLASAHAHVGAVVFAWERGIPFMAWTIVPYWSIDAFYGLSLFACSTKIELDRHGRRLLTAQILAVACFILFPLQFTFTRPVVTGFLGSMYEVLASFDRPFNQAPSLHIALLIILWDLYPRHLPRWATWTLHTWFALVGLSVLTTYQHHFIDVPTGALLGFVCLWLWPEHGANPLRRAEFARNGKRWTIAACYAAGSTAIAVFGSWIGGAGLWLFWPAISLTLVAANYAWFGADGFQKGADGRMSLAARCLYAPYLLGAWINSRLWTRGDGDPALVRDRVSLGRIPARGEAVGFATIVDLCAEVPDRSGSAACNAYPLLDLIAPDPDRLREIACAIERARAAGSVLVCCALGYSRSASAVAAWLLTTGRATTSDDAMEQIRRVRGSIVLNSEARTNIELACR